MDPNRALYCWYYWGHVHSGDRPDREYREYCAGYLEGWLEAGGKEPDWGGEYMGVTLPSRQDFTMR